MSDELQHLIERIQKEAVEAAEQQAAQIVAQAKDKAAQQIREAEEQARARLTQADKEAAAFAERSQRTLEQAARDLLISVGQGVQKILDDIVEESVDQALRPELLERMLVTLLEAYVGRRGEESRVEVLVSPNDQQELVRFFADQYRQRLLHGVELHADNEIFRGFKVSFADGHAYHDFTREAIAEALANFLRPHLAQIVNRVAQQGAQAGRTPGP